MVIVVTYHSQFLIDHYFLEPQSSITILNVYVLESVVSLIISLPYLGSISKFFIVLLAPRQQGWN